MKHIIEVSDLIVYPPRNVVDFLYQINKSIIEEYHNCKYATTFEFPEPYLTKESVKREIVKEVLRGGYLVNVKTERISVTDVILSMEISWEEHFVCNKNRVREFFLLGRAVGELGYEKD